MTGSYAVNGVSLILQPTSGRWLPRTELGRDGRGIPVYPGVYEFEMNFSVGSPTGTYQLQQLWNQMQTSGQYVVVDLPRYNHFGYEFFAYSGCVISEPQVNNYFYANYLEVNFLISNIRV